MSRDSTSEQLHEAQLDALAVIEAVMRDDHDALEAITGVLAGLRMTGANPAENTRAARSALLGRHQQKD